MARCSKAKHLSRKNQYKLYKDVNKRSVNAVKRLARHLKKHPTDIQSKEQRKAIFPPKPKCSKPVIRGKK